MKLDISKQLAKLMRDQNLSQSALSRATGVPKPTINRILSEVTREPRRDSVVRIANYFGVTPESLYESTSKKSKPSLDESTSVEQLYHHIRSLSQAERTELFAKIAASFNQA
jgi:transcriptional regulator with XRE-family HTH domain